MWPLALALSAIAFESLGPGVETATAQLSGGAEVSLVRIDVTVARLEFGVAAQSGASAPCGAWADKRGWVAALNAGMYETDYLTNVGHFEHSGVVLQRRWNAYQSVLLVGPKRAGLPQAQMVDRDDAAGAALIGQYTSMVQNLRLMKGPGLNVWKPNGTPWPEAFVAQDKQGRLLFGFVQKPLEMATLVDELLALPLGLVRAMHVEGGPPACFSIRGPRRPVDLAGNIAAQRPIPNALGVRGGR